MVTHLTFESVESSNIAEVAHCNESSVLALKYKSPGTTYIYLGVSEEIYNCLKLAESVGKFVNQIIKPTYQCVGVPNGEAVLEESVSAVL